MEKRNSEMPAAGVFAFVAKRWFAVSQEALMDAVTDSQDWDDGYEDKPVAYNGDEDDVYVQLTEADFQ